MTVVDGDELMSVGEIGSDQGEGGSSDAKGGLETGDENGVIDRVKGSTEVKEDENIEEASVSVSGSFCPVFGAETGLEEFEEVVGV